MREVQVRPRYFGLPLVVGTLYLDVATAELVRFRFSFTPAAYLDRQLEDISIVLENGRFENRWWLPHRQEIEIRRRAKFLDFPARGIIRGRWEIAEYDLNVAVPPAVLSGPAIGGLRARAPGRFDLGSAAGERDRGGGDAGESAGHGRAAGRGRAHRRISGPRRAPCQSPRGWIGQRSRPGQPGPGSRPRFRRGHRGQREPDSAAAPGRLRNLRRSNHRRTRPRGGERSHPGLLDRRTAAARSRRSAGDLTRAQLPALPGGGGRLRRLRADPQCDRGRAPPVQRPHLGLASGRSGREPVGRRERLAGQRPLSGQSGAGCRELSGRSRVPRAGQRWDRGAAGPSGEDRARGR